MAQDAVREILCFAVKTPQPSMLRENIFFGTKSGQIFGVHEGTLVRTVEELVSATVPKFSPAGLAETSPFACR